MEEGIVIGGGCTFLKLAQAVDGIKATLENDEQRVTCLLLFCFAVRSQRQKAPSDCTAGRNGTSACPSFRFEIRTATVM